MRLMDPETFVHRYFDPECLPDLRSVRQSVEDGLIPGRVLGEGKRRRYWIDADAWERAPATGNELADRILQA